MQSLKKTLNANEPSAYYALGRRLNRTGAYPQASEVLTRLVELIPNHSLAHYELGFALLQQFSRQSEAIEHFRQAIDICPHIARAYYFLGWALVRIKRDFAAAKQLLDQIKEFRTYEAQHLAHLISLNKPSD